jgi:hypothetical protein
VRTDSASSGHDFELLIDAAIAEGHGSADPEAVALGGCNLVTHLLADDLALELAKREQHVEGEPRSTQGADRRVGQRR